LAKISLNQFSRLLLFYRVQQEKKRLQQEAEIGEMSELGEVEAQDVLAESVSNPEASDGINPVADLIVEEALDEVQEEVDEVTCLKAEANKLREEVRLIREKARMQARNALDVINKLREENERLQKTSDGLDQTQKSLEGVQEKGIHLKAENIALKEQLDLLSHALEKRGFTFKAQAL